MKNVLLLAHDDAGQEARLQAALDLTRALQGHLTVVDVSMLPVPPGDYFTGDTMGLLLDAEQKRESANRNRIKARIAHEGVAWDWIDVTGDPAPCVEDAAQLADIIVVSRKLDSAPMPDTVEIASELIVKVRKPVLAVPEHGSRLDLAGRVLVAWDGSREASAALQAAVPLLRLASDVRLLEIDDGSLDVPAEEAAAYLSRHGIEPEIERRSVGQASVEEILLAAVMLEAPAYVVMGGFGHSRTREFIFGGTTRSMLCHSPVPVLLSH